MTKKYLLFITLISFIRVNAQTGIGTTTPVNKLQIEATTADPASSGSSANGNLRLSGSSGLHVLDFGLSSTPTFSWLQARSKSNYATLYNLVLNPNGGNVGIGNTSPSTTLTVGNASGTVGGEILLNPTSTQYEGGQIVFKKSLLGSTVDWTIDQYGTTSSNARLRIFNGSSEINGIAILENGNVGIGSVAPTARLNISGGGVRIFSGFGNSTNRPALNTGTVGNYEIRGVGAGGGATTGAAATSETCGTAGAATTTDDAFTGSVAAFMVPSPKCKGPYRANSTSAPTSNDNAPVNCLRAISANTPSSTRSVQVKFMGG